MRVTSNLPTPLPSSPAPLPAPVPGSAPAPAEATDSCTLGQDFQTLHDVSRWAGAGFTGALRDVGPGAALVVGPVSVAASALAFYSGASALGSVATGAAVCAASAASVGTMGALVGVVIGAMVGFRDPNA